MKVSRFLDLIKEKELAEKYGDLELRAGIPGNAYELDDSTLFVVSYGTVYLNLRG